MKLDIDSIRFISKEEYYNNTFGKYHDNSNFLDERVLKEKHRNKLLPACKVMNENLIKFSNNETFELNDIFYDFIIAHMNNREKKENESK